MDIPKGINFIDYQLEMLNTQLAYAVGHSRFYREKLAGVELPLKTLADIKRLPFTTAADITGHGGEMVCGGAGMARRVVTINSAGTGGAPKRLFFSETDLKRTEDFFTAGMRYMCDAGDRVMIFMPADSENGIGQLLVRGLTELGAIPYAYGLISDFDEAAAALRQERYHTAIGIPAQIRKLALLAPDIRPANVLLSADYVSAAAKETISRLWGCEVFTHYGLTETGYGCAVECRAHDGQHIRHDELLVEIVEPEWAGSAAAEAAPTAAATTSAAADMYKPGTGWGEIVITTLRREAMPLIRYRTGDLGRLIQGRCACGSELPRLDQVQGRLQELQYEINIYRMDELLQSRDEILDYHTVMNASGLFVALEAAAGAETGAVVICRDILSRTWPETPAIVRLAGDSPVTLVSASDIRLSTDGDSATVFLPQSDSPPTYKKLHGWTVKRGIERIGNISVL